MYKLLNFIFLGLFLVFVTPADAANRFAICATTCTWDNTNTGMWSTTSGGATGASVPGSGDIAIFDAATCTGGTTCTTTVAATINGTNTIQGLTMGACTASTTGCIIDFSVNNPSFTIGTTADLSGTGVRTLRMGSGTWSLSSASAIWTAATSTNMTLTAGTSTINFIATSNVALRQFLGGGLTYSSVTFSSPSTFLGQSQITFSGSNTYSQLNFNAPNTVSFGGTTQTITRGFTWTGSSTAPLIFLGSTNANTGTISSASNGTITGAVPVGLTFSGGGTFTCTGCFNPQNTTGITITTPSSGGGRIIGG